MKKMTEREAKAKGYTPLTIPYTRSENHLMQKVIGDMKSGNIPHTLVDEEEGVSVWRK